jgi:hypothetical protein
MDSHRGQSLESAEVCLLTDWLLGIVRTSIDEGGEITNSVKLIAGRRKRATAEFVKVQPFVGRVLEAPVIQIEGIYVEIGSHGRKKAKVAFWATLLPNRRTDWGGILSTKEMLSMAEEKSSLHVK